MRRITVYCLALALILLGLTGLAAAQNVSIQLTPQGVPIQIPGTGGSFNYTIAATNNGTTPQRTTVWCMITLPNGNSYGPVLGPVRITLSPGQTIERQRTQVIPAGFSTGNYSFNGYVGVYPDSIWDSDTFPFEKTLAGSELWVAIYNGPANDADWAEALAIDGAGYVYVTGKSASNLNNWDCTTIKYNSSGNQVWVAFYNGPGNAGDGANCVALDDSENVYITGYSYGTGTDYDYVTIKYNSDGNQIWVARYTGPANGIDEATALALDSSGNVYVTGYSTSETDYDYATIKYNSSGNQIWVARYTEPGFHWDRASSLAVDGSGNVFVTGDSYGSGTNYDYATVKYDAAGHQIWLARYNGPGNGYDGATSLALDGSGNIYVTGSSTGPGTSYDYATIKYNSAGTQQWAARYSGSAGSYDISRSLALDGAGNVYVTGWAVNIGTSSDYTTIKYGNNGSQIWIAQYDGPANDADNAYSLALDIAGNVYVTGVSTIVNIPFDIDEDWATIKYGISGQQLWVATYDGPGDYGDWANAVSPDSDGNVYVTGVGSGIGTNDGDYTTIKYSGGNIDNWMPMEATVLGQPLPQECRLEQNFPNPFNATTVLRYKMQDARYVSLKVYDTSGRSVATLVDGWRQAGVHELTFDAFDLPSGVYFALLEGGEYMAVQKMMLLK